jgi:hypothetical protein
VKIYACYTDSHRPLLEQHFLPSIPKGFDVVLRKNPQSCPSGIFGRTNWSAAMQDKIRLVLDALATEKKPFIVSDVDIRFYSLSPENVEPLLGDYSITYQLDRPLNDHSPPSPCAGFAIVRPCEANVQLYTTLLQSLPQYGTEQAALSGHAIPALNKPSGYKIGYLPPERFWNIMHDVKYVRGNRLAIHHANWVTGIAAKLDLLSSVQQIRNFLEER